MRINRCGECGSKADLTVVQMTYGETVLDSAFVLCLTCDNGYYIDQKEALLHFDNEPVDVLAAHFWNEQNNPSLMFLTGKVLDWIKQKGDELWKRLRS